MKRLSFIMMALAMVMAFTQCKKDNQNPTENNAPEENVEGTHITLALGGNSNTRLDIDFNFSDSNKAPVRYQIGDTIQVAYLGKWVGSLKCTSVSSESLDQNNSGLGIFEGTITTPAPAAGAGTDPLYFYYLGRHRYVTSQANGAYDELVVDLSDQSVELPVISYAMSEQNYEQGVDNYTVKYNWLKNQCALVKFTMENIYDQGTAMSTTNSNDQNTNAIHTTTQQITISGMKNQVTIDLSNPATSADQLWGTDGNWNHNLDESFTWGTKSNSNGNITLYSPSATEEVVRYAIVAPGSYEIEKGNLEVAFNPVSDPHGFFGTYRLYKEEEIQNNAYYKDAKLDLVWHSGAISIGSGSYVVFSRGNVQYANLAAGQSGTANYRPAGTWRFAKHQYDFVGGMDNNGTHQSNVVKDETGSSATMSNNENVGKTDYDGWIDMFGWGTGNAPTQTTTTNTWYTNTNGFHDWGANNFVNSGKPGNTAWWTTLTHTEWNNVIKRDNEAKVGLATITGSIYGNTVGYTNSTDVPGLVILPDNFTNPYSWKPVSAGTTLHPAEFSDNTYDLAQWTEMEKAGAVFLPAAGWRNDTDGKWRATISLTKRDLEHGCYQSSTASTDAAVWQLRFGTDYRTHDRINQNYAMAPDNGHCVRLVHRL